MRLYDLITEEDTNVLPERVGDRKTYSFSIETPEGDSADITFDVVNTYPENPNEDEYMFFIDIYKLKIIKCDEYTMSRVLNQIGTHLINMINDERIYDWAYKIVTVTYDLGDKIDDPNFKSLFNGGGTDFENAIINRFKKVSDMFANVVRPLPRRLDVESIEKEYYKAKKRLEFIQTEHFEDGEYDGYEYKSKLIYPRITSDHRYKMAPNELINGRNIHIEGDRIDIAYDLRFKETGYIQTSPDWEERLAKHVLHYYLINGVRVQYVYINGMEKGKTKPRRKNQFSFRPDEIL